MNEPDPWTPITLPETAALYAAEAARHWPGTRARRHALHMAGFMMTCPENSEAARRRIAEIVH